MDMYDFRDQVVREESRMEFSSAQFVYAEVTGVDGTVYAVTGMRLDDDGDLMIELGWEA